MPAEGGSAVSPELQSYLELRKHLQAKTDAEWAEIGGPVDELLDTMDAAWDKLSEADIAWLNAQKNAA